MIVFIFPTLVYSQDFQPFKFGEASEKIKKEFNPNSTGIGTSYKGSLGYIMPQGENETYSVAGVKSRVVDICYQHVKSGDTERP